MRVAAGTDQGRVRASNEDSILADASVGVLIVADGMGGHRGGEVASDLAAATIHSILREALSSPEAPGVDPVSLLSRAIEEANQAVWARASSDQELHGMGTTVVVAHSRGDRLWIAHAGDSRAYLLGPGGMTLLTNDHSLVAQMVRSGEITADDARRHPLRNVISRCLGTGKTVQPEIRDFTWTAGETLLLCSDGLTGMLEDAEIEATVRSAGEDLETACRSLIRLANEKGGKDNVSVILARNTG
ncbi:MAG: Stp1/IreP family PP2C-type Ser/Thr phosphatase [Bryobacterales bacterium]|nr:Stp1/IreP family PP2C-type Ser/Thr phosphatase [Bryobacterales bacterium]